MAGIGVILAGQSALTAIEEHEAMRQWAGRAFHPEKLDLQATDEAVKPPVAKPAATMSSVASKSAQPATAIVANRTG